MASIPKLLILDADGTLRWTSVPGQRYPLHAHEWHLMPNVSETLRGIAWAQSGPWLAIASNQPAVGEGRIEKRLAHAFLESAIEAALGHVPAETRIEMCTCADGKTCPRKKPAPGMLHALLAHYALAPHEALFVGDQPIDAEAAARAGVPFMSAQQFFSK